MGLERDMTERLSLSHYPRNYIYFIPLNKELS